MVDRGKGHGVDDYHISHSLSRMPTPAAIEEANRIARTREGCSTWEEATADDPVENEVRAYLATLD